MMYETRDDTLPRSNEVIAYFSRNLERDALAKLRAEFKAVWSSPTKITNPLYFKVVVCFGRVLPDPILKAVETELKDHGWTNFQFIQSEAEGTAQTTVTVRLDKKQAEQYA